MKIMTREEQQLLLIDISARLRYGVKFALSDNNIYTMKGIDLIVTNEGDWKYAVTAKGISPIEIEYIKPYLRTMSSMTEEEYKELQDSYWCGSGINQYTEFGCIDWLNEYHFDYRGLIKKGLALEAPEEMYKIK